MVKEIVKDPKKEKALLDESMKLFAKHGYRETKTDDIVKLAGVSKGLLFHYFGNKANLYVACYDYASQFFYQRVDYSVWTDSDDLIAMVVNATRYKIQMQLDYPTEFNYLMRTFSETSQLPQPLQETIQQKLSSDIIANLGVMNDVVGRLPLRDNLTSDIVIEVLNTFMDSELKKVQRELSNHPEWQSMEDIEPLIDRIKLDLDILEHGFTAK